MPWSLVPKDWSAVTLPFLVTASVLQQELHDKLVVLGVHTHTGASGEGSADLTPGSIAMSGPLYGKKGAAISAIASNAIVVTADGDYFSVTAATGTINSITATRQAGARIVLQFVNAQTLTHNATSMILATGTNWAVPAGAAIELVSEGSNNWRELWRWAVSPSLALTPTSITMSGPIYGSQGANVVTAATLPILADGNFWVATGATQVDKITMRQAGTSITIFVNTGFTFSHLAGGSGQLSLAGSINWAAPSSARITFISDGAIWYETARTIP